MVRTTGTPFDPASLNEMPEPTWRALLQRGLPRFGIESIVPIVVFYGAWRLLGLLRAVVCATLLSLAIAGWQIRGRRGGALAVVAAIFIVIQALVALAAHSATVYLAQPVVLSACWGLVYLGSVFVGRPLIGVFASAWYPFPRLSREYALPARVRDADSRLGRLLPHTRSNPPRRPALVRHRQLRVCIGPDRCATPRRARLLGDLARSTHLHPARDPSSDISAGRLTRQHTSGLVRAHN